MKCILFIVFIIFAVKADQPGNVKINIKEPEVLVHLGDRFDVRCSVTEIDNSNHQLDWTKTPSQNNQKSQKIIASETISDLTLHSIKKADLGDYECSYGSSKAGFRLISPTEDIKDANFTYNGDTSVTLSCALSDHSKKVSKVEWLKNDTMVKDLSDKKRFKEEGVNLTISDTTREDADLYIARFTFEGTSSHYDCKVPFRAEPLVLKFDKSKNLIEDDTMELQCKVKGYPRSVVTWHKNSHVLNISDSERIVQSPLNGYENARLVIKKVQFDDAGDYTCEAFSAFFNVSVKKTLVVRVKDKLAALWPFLGIVGEVVVLCIIIFIYEKRRNKQAENEANNAPDADGSISDKKEGLRHRNPQSNPTA